VRISISEEEHDFLLEVIDHWCNPARYEKNTEIVRKFSEKLKQLKRKSVAKKKKK
jgi:hypothetical protein